MPDSKLRLSIILPAFNERENLPLLIPEVINVLSSLTEDYEIILVDDGSTDGTHKIAADIISRFSKTKYIRLKKNQGLSTALAIGYKNCSGEIIITMDSDLQYDPKDIPKLLEKLDKYDLVCGWRYNRCDSFLKRISSKIANSIRNIITKDNINDAGCIFRVLRRDSLKYIELFDGFHRFLPTLFKLKGFKVIEIKVNHLPRRYGKSKYNIRSRIIITFFDTLMIKWMKGRQIDYDIVEKID